jgi:hypothetical protein
MWANHAALFQGMTERSYETRKGLGNVGSHAGSRSPFIDQSRRGGNPERISRIARGGVQSSQEGGPPDSIDVVRCRVGKNLGVQATAGIGRSHVHCWRSRAGLQHAPLEPILRVRPKAFLDGKCLRKPQSTR